MYSPEYVSELRNAVANSSKAIAFLSDYIPIKHGKVGPRDKNSKIRRFLRSPLKNRKLASTRFWKRAVLSLGNSICCPSVTYHKEILGDSFFTSEYKFNIDWDTFLKFSEIDGTLLYVDKPLTFYRISDEATSKEFIENHLREKDDTEMFRKFWPEWVVKIIMHFYKAAYKTYD